MLKPNEREFEALAAQGYNLIPVWREIAADLETPVSAFLKVARGEYAFLLESVQGGEKWGRYTFLGSEPAMVLRGRGGRLDLTLETHERLDETLRGSIADALHEGQRA